MFFFEKLLDKPLAASLRWYYPDQVHRVSSTPGAATSQPFGSPSSDIIALRQTGKCTFLLLPLLYPPGGGFVKG